MTDPRRTLLTIPAAASELSVSVSTLRRLIRDGEIPTVRIRSIVRVLATDLDAFAERHATVVAPPRDIRADFDMIKRQTTKREDPPLRPRRSVGVAIDGLPPRMDA